MIVQHNGRFLHFSSPVQEFTAWRADEVMGVLRAVETAVSHQNRTAAGFISYEAAAAFGLAVHPPMDGLPLVWFGLYETAEVDTDLAEFTDFPALSWRASMSAANYREAIDQIKREIAAGNTYQVNYTFPLHAEFDGDGRNLFTQLAQNQAAGYAAYVANGRFANGRYAIASASPELFFALDGENLYSKPMKGTAVRGRTLAEDDENAARLTASVKNRAENVMIVDMIRNDMGRVATVGTVQTPHLFEVERYPTVLQMTSTVTARTDAPIADIIAAMFPCASITGAPKKRTMELIKRLEPSPRGIYTGAIGFIAPNRQVQFNVAIRTVLLDRQEKRAIYGVGGGIVWDSTADDEYEECKVKAKVLGAKRPSFALLESLLWEPEGGYLLLAYHLDRLRQSMRYFGDWGSGDGELSAARELLRETAVSLTAASKVRLLLAQDGKITITHAPITPLPDPARVVLAKTAVSRDNSWLYHKTTHRTVYDNARNPAYDETILWNEDGEITEGTSSNIVVKIGGEFFTPPIESGLLAGTFRRHLLATGKVQERIISKQMLHSCDAMYLINSVRRWRRAILSIDH